MARSQEITWNEGLGSAAGDPSGGASLAPLLRRSVRVSAGVSAPPETPRRVLIVGSGPRAWSFWKRLTHERSGRAYVLGFVDSNADVQRPEIRERTLGTLEDLDHVLMGNVVDEVLITLPIKSCYTEIQRAIESCERGGVECRYPIDLFQHKVARPRVELSGEPAIAMPMVREGPQVLVKRMLDVALSLVGLVALSPLLLATALLVRLTSPGPILFTQDRCGHRKRSFRMYKFRTMVDGADRLQEELEKQNEAVGPIFKIRDDPRFTPIGRFLRVTSLDELPQLWNVLRGDMSLVGPRPMAWRDVGLFTDPAFMRRFSVPPGITGLWQVSGRSNLSFRAWLDLDLEYIDNWSVWLDLKILLRTIPTVLFCRGAA